jgi:hypothetical protein
MMSCPSGPGEHGASCTRPCEVGSLSCRSLLGAARSDHSSSGLIPRGRYRSALPRYPTWGHPEPSDPPGAHSKRALLAGCVSGGAPSVSHGDRGRRTGSGQQDGERKYTQANVSLQSSSSRRDHPPIPDALDVIARPRCRAVRSPMSYRAGLTAGDPLSARRFALIGMRVRGRRR